MSEQEPRRYLTDDRDHEPEQRHELVIFPGGNGDWYLGVWPEGARGSPNTVRICTSGGASSTVPALPISCARMYRALGPKQEQPKDLLQLALTEQEGACPHSLVLPMETGFGRCMACGDDSFPMTGMAANQCQSCGSYGEHAKTCDGAVRQPWAVAKQALEELRRTYGGPVPSTMDSTVLALRRIMGEVVDVHIPGTTMFITYDNAFADKARWKASDSEATIRATLALLGLEWCGKPRVMRGEAGDAPQVLEVDLVRFAPRK